MPETPFVNVAIDEATIKRIVRLTAKQKRRMHDVKGTIVLSAARSIGRSPILTWRRKVQVLD